MSCQAKQGGGGWPPSARGAVCAPWARCMPAAAGRHPQPRHRAAVHKGEPLAAEQCACYHTSLWPLPARVSFASAPACRIFLNLRGMLASRPLKCLAFTFLRSFCPLTLSTAAAAVAGCCFLIMPGPAVCCCPSRHLLQPRGANLHLLQPAMRHQARQRAVTVGD